MEEITICMLGDFSLRVGNARISDSGNRSRKVWSLLAYLICSRERPVPQKKLIDLFWGEEDDCVSPENALRITLHRLRSGILDQLWPGAGRELILHREGGYCFNPQAEIRVDCDRFEALCKGENREESQRLADILEALELYRGEFLPRHSGELWVIPISTHFQNCRLQVSLEAAELLLKERRWEEAARICRETATAEPYHEGLHQLWMRALSGKGDGKAAGAVYENLHKRLFDDFGIRPSQETREVYRAAVHGMEDRALPIDEVLEDLQEPPTEAGAMVCDYDYFKVLCYAESRSIERSGNATHVALLSVAGLQGEPLSRRSLERVMGQLEQILRKNLRRGDTISRCSVSQYIVMLPRANYENSCMVCRRILAAFHLAHPRTVVKVNYMVQPLTPSIRVP